MTIKISLPAPGQFSDLTIGQFLTNAGFVPQKVLAFDKELYPVKWWDYRFMTPFEATIAYIDIFGQEARKIYARDIDSERAQHIRVVTGEKVVEKLVNNDSNAKRALVGFWRGRQVADALGMPYATYIYEAMSQRMRAWQRVYLPSSNQLYREADVERVAGRWEQINASRIHYAEHHAYLAQNYQAAPVQDAYCDYLYARAQTSGALIQTLTDMVEADRLPLEYLAAAHRDICDRVQTSLM